MANPVLPTKTILSALTTETIWNVDTLTSATNWNGGTSLGQPISISFSFVSSLASYFYNAGTIAVNPDALGFVNKMVDISNPANFTAFNPGQRVATDQAIYAWQAVANVTFNNVGDNNPNAVR